MQTISRLVSEARTLLERIKPTHSFPVKGAWASLLKRVPKNVQLKVTQVDDRGIYAQVAIGGKIPHWERPLPKGVQAAVNRAVQATAGADWDDMGVIRVMEHPRGVELKDVALGKGRAVRGTGSLLKPFNYSNDPIRISDIGKKAGALREADFMKVLRVMRPRGIKVQQVTPANGGFWVDTDSLVTTAIVRKFEKRLRDYLHTDYIAVKTAEDMGYAPSNRYWVEASRYQGRVRSIGSRLNK
jgi:hypothetical protein